MTLKHLAARFLVTSLMAAMGVVLASHADASSRIKDIVDVEGVRTNQLIGYGIVVGLNGTGDTVRNSPMLMQSMQSSLERIGVNIHDATLNTKNAAVVMVTAELPPFSAPGSTLDVTVASMGDAKSLLGGTLLMTPLRGADGGVYATAQGTVQTGAISASGASGSSVTRGVPTAGRIAAGGTIEQQTGWDFNAMPVVHLTLHNPDFTTARRVADIIDSQFPGCALAQNPSVIAVKPPAGTSMMDFITQVESLNVDVDTPAKVVIDEVNGVIVVGENVRISRVAIAQGNLTIKVDEQPSVSQPLPFSQGQTAAVPSSTISVDEDKGKQLMQLGGGSTLSDLVAGLNALKVTPRDMIAILQSIKAAGALQADIEVL